MMFDEIEGYQKGKWKELCAGWQHDENSVKGFFGDYRFLSNFFPCEVIVEGIQYKSSEVAYQAMKLKREYRKEFSKLNSYDSKKYWNKCPLKWDEDSWNEIKSQVMFPILFDKFSRNEDLRIKLLETDDRHLEETNWWGDVYWGVCNGSGLNVLGSQLMRIREILK